MLRCLALAAIVSLCPLPALGQVAKEVEVPQDYGNTTWMYSAGMHLNVSSLAGRPVFGARSEAAQADCRKAALASDQKGIDELVASGRGAILAEGTRVLVIASHRQDILEVRALDGAYRDEIFFLSINNLVETQPFPLGVGQEGVLIENAFRTMDSRVYLSATPQAYNRLMRDWELFDTANLSPMLSSKEVVTVPVGTRIRVRAVCCSPERFKAMGLVGHAVRVEIVSGLLKGKQAWVPPSAVAVPPPKRRPR